MKTDERMGYWQRSARVPSDRGQHRVTATLARAFQHDPMMRFLLPDDVKRARTLPWFLGTVVRYCRVFGKVQVSAEQDAIACWLTPGNTTVTPGRIFRSGGALTPVKLGLGGFGRLMALQAYLAQEHEKNMPEPHFYLYLLGVDPLSRGQGLGRQLLAPTLGRAAHEGRACYLETQNEKNVAVYRSVGFEVTSVGQVAGSTLTVWTMRRDPKRRPV